MTGRKLLYAQATVLPLTHVALLAKGDVIAPKIKGTQTWVNILAPSGALPESRTEGIG